MTVTYKGMWGRSATNTKGIRTYTRTFKLQASSQDDDEYAVGSHASLPQIGSQHPSDNLAWCVSLQVDNSNPPLGWTVTANYDSSFELNINPIFDPAQISWDWEQFETAAIVDKDGNGITNSAGDFFKDPVPTRDDSRPVVTITKNVVAVPTYLLTFQDAVNVSAFVVDGFAVGAGKAKCNKIGVSSQQERNGFQFRVLTLELHLQRDDWTLKPPDVGHRYKSGSTRLGVVSDDGTGPATPVQLDGAGAVVANPTTATVVYLSYSVYNTADFNLLPLT